MGKRKGYLERKKKRGSGERDRGKGKNSTGKAGGGDETKLADPGGMKNIKCSATHVPFVGTKMHGGKGQTKKKKKKKRGEWGSDNGERSRGEESTGGFNLYRGAISLLLDN